MGDADPENSGGFTKDSSGVFANPSGLPTDGTDFEGWTWKQIMAAINGGAAIAPGSDGQQRALQISNPETLFTAASTFNTALLNLNAVAEIVTDQTAALAGPDGAWKGKGADQFVTMMSKFVAQVLARANQLSGGAAHIDNFVTQLYNDGVYLRWAQETIRYIDGFYAQQVIAMGHQFPDGRAHIADVPEAVTAMTANMKVVGQTLAAQYNLVAGKFSVPDMTGFGGGPGGPPPPVPNPDKLPPPPPPPNTGGGPPPPHLNTSVPPPNIPPPPNLKTPNLKTPDLKTPNLKTPNLKDPSLESPNLKSPDLKSPNLTAPNLKSPDLADLRPPSGTSGAGLPNLTAPALPLPPRLGGGAGKGPGGAPKSGGGLSTMDRMPGPKSLDGTDPLGSDAKLRDAARRAAEVRDPRSGGLPMMPGTPGGAGGGARGQQGTDRPDAAGLLGGEQEPWQGLEPPDGSGEPSTETETRPDTAEPWATAPPGMPMAPGTPGAGKDADDRPDAAGLLGGEQEPWLHRESPRELDDPAPLTETSAQAAEAWAVTGAEKKAVSLTEAPETGGTPAQAVVLPGVPLPAVPLPTPTALATPAVPRSSVAKPVAGPTSTATNDPQQPDEPGRDRRLAVVTPPRGGADTAAWDDGASGLLALLVPARLRPAGETRQDHMTYRRRRHGEAPVVADGQGPTCAGDDPSDDPPDGRTDPADAEHDGSADEGEEDRSAADLLTQDGSAWTSTGADLNGVLA
ncbi:hypothetical protein [Actinophytocola sp.]|uniref:hypothetical protein n=1 Tax=Actinophytocola sp. TaxID=1872138 RepID=UPI002D408218|nr:hypothetical protein [Actinophytocola sp.]HYQ64010.1 hypothetical protein [Actinophytocola sp.]